MTTQRSIVKWLHGAFVNSPPSRLKQLTTEACIGTSNKKLDSLIAKMEVMLQFLKNVRRIRDNQVEQVMMQMPDSNKHKQRIINAIKAGKLP